MFRSFSRTIWRRLLIFCIVLKASHGSEWDPLPEGVRTAVSSNHLSEVTPQVFAEYHALLPNYRGDYGIKSKLVEAATQDPTYKGANTLIFPLYIPQGAIPLAINERSTRSGKADGIANMRILRGPIPSVRDLSRDSSINRPLTRRVIVTRRRPNGSRSHPTPPPSFIRSWMRRDPTLAKNQDNVEEAKRSKQRLLSQKAQSKRRGETSTLPSTSTTPSTPLITTINSTAKNVTTETTSTKVPPVTIAMSTGDDSFQMKDATRIKKIMTKLDKVYVGDPNFENTTPNLISTVIEIRKINRTATNAEVPSSERPVGKGNSILKTIDKIISSAVTQTPNVTLENSTLTNLSLSTNRPAIEKSETNVTNVSDIKKLIIPSPELLEEIVHPRMKPAIPTPSIHKYSTTQYPSLNRSSITAKVSFSTPKPATSTIFSNVKSQQKSPSWLLRRRASLMKEMNARKESQKISRLKQENAREENAREENESIIDRVLISAANQQHVLSSNKSLTSASPKVNIASATSETTTKDPLIKLTTSPTTTISTSTVKVSITNAKPSPSRQRVPIRSRKPIVSNPTRATSTPSTILLPRRRESIYPRTNYEAKKNRQIFTTNTIGTSTPKATVTNSPPSIPIVVNFDKSSSTIKPVSSSFKPKMRSPQDIVLEKLSELMKNASEGAKESLSDIARQIERLNDELASMGIHIIDAEFNGHKIKLKDQFRSSRNGSNFSGATTIRYVIPNTKNRNNLHRVTSSDNKNKRLKITTTRPTQRSYFTLTHSGSPSRRITTPPYISQPIIIERKRANTSQISTIITNPTTKTTAELDKETINSFNISPSSAIPSSESTRTKSILVPVSTQEYPDSNSSAAPSSVTPIPKSLNPTAHRRPSVTAADSTTEKHIKELTIDDFHPIDGNKNDKAISYNNNSVLNKLNGTFTLLASEYDVDVEKETEASGSYLYFIGLAVIPCVAAVIFVYRQRQKRERKALPEREERADGYTPPICHTRQTCHNSTLDAFPGYVFETTERESPWELSRSKLRITSVIGEGNFGIVWKAEARNLCDWEENGGPTVLVAVKGVKEGAGTKEKSDLLREMAIMQLLGQHNNIVTLLGCCTKQEPYYLVMEYVMFGKLLEFLREQRSKNNYFNFSSDTDHLTSRDLTKFACQIATGCEYLQTRGVIHRDLAARNILVDHNKICKIADFGMARRVKDTDNDIYEQKSKGPLPIRWMAPESLYMNIYTHKSDVWSFGILCWEIVTLGSTPYPGISAREVMRRVREGYRLERPEHCRPEFYKIVSKCWTQDLSSRVNFVSIKEEIRDLLDNSSGWIDLENFQEATYYSMHQNNEEKL